MIVFHVAIQTGDDYLAKRAPHREAHLERLMALRARGLVIGGGPSPDGRRADVFYRVYRATGPDVEPWSATAPRTSTSSGASTIERSRNFIGGVER